MSHVIEITGLTKTFQPSRGIAKWFSRSPIHDEIHALQDVTLHVQKGEIFGLLGPNGAGKTTLLKVLSTLVRPTSGEVKIFGYDLDRDEEKIKERIGLVYSDERSFYWRLSGRENLRFYGSLLGLHGKKIETRLQELTQLLEMEPFLDNRYDAYSSGMKQRLAVARGLLGEPDLLLLDEPTRGLDPLSSEKLLKQVRLLSQEQQTAVLLVTHSLPDAEKFCDRIGILHQGRMVCQGRFEELRVSFVKAGRYRFHVGGLHPEILSRIEHFAFITDLHWSKVGGESKIDFEIQEPGKNLSRIFEQLHHHHVPILHVESVESELNAIFTLATKKEAG